MDKQKAENEAVITVGDSTMDEHELKAENEVLTTVDDTMNRQEAENEALTTAGDTVDEQEAESEALTTVGDTMNKQEAESKVLTTVGDTNMDEQEAENEALAAVDYTIDKQEAESKALTTVGDTNMDEQEAENEVLAAVDYTMDKQEAENEVLTTVDDTMDKQEAENEGQGLTIVGDTGFHFTESGEFLDGNGKKFEFNAFVNYADNQLRYEEIGDAITDHIYQLMEQNYGLKKVYYNIPVGADTRDSSFVFVSHDFQSSGKKKLILINGSGAVRAGQWARSIIINSNIYPGSMLPYISWAKENDIDVLVMNTNECGPDKSGSCSPLEHAQTAWNEFLYMVKERTVYIVAHSFGGVVVQDLMEKYPKFNDIVSNVAFTDSVHMGKLQADQVSCINWVTSTQPADTSLGERSGCILRSAGTTKHPWTSHYAMNHIFAWFMENKKLSLFARVRRSFN